MSEVYTMNGILRGKNLDSTNGLPVGASIERVKEGKPVGNAHGYWLGEKKITDVAIKALESLNVGEEIQYSSSNYVVTDIWKKGSRGGGGKGGGGYQKDPVEEAKTRRSIERQKAADIAAQVYIACINKSAEPVSKTYKEMMATIREEAALLADAIGEPVKGGSP